MAKKKKEKKKFKREDLFELKKPPREPVQEPDVPEDPTPNDLIDLAAGEIKKKTGQIGSLPIGSSTEKILGLPPTSQEGGTPSFDIPNVQPRMDEIQQQLAALQGREKPQSEQILEALLQGIEGLAPVGIGALMGSVAGVGPGAGAALGAGRGAQAIERGRAAKEKEKSKSASDRSEERKSLRGMLSNLQSFDLGAKLKKVQSEFGRETKIESANAAHGRKVFLEGLKIKKGDIKRGQRISDAKDLARWKEWEIMGPRQFENKIQSQSKDVYLASRRRTLGWGKTLDFMLDRTNALFSQAFHEATGREARPGEIESLSDNDREQAFDKLDARQIFEIVKSLNNALATGEVTENDIKMFYPRTWRLMITKEFEEILNERMPAHAGTFLNTFYKTVQREQKIAQTRVSEEAGGFVSFSIEKIVSDERFNNNPNFVNWARRITRDHDVPADYYGPEIERFLVGEPGSPLPGAEGEITEEEDIDAELRKLGVQ